MWERQVPIGEMYALSAFKQLRGKSMWFSRCYGVVLVAFGAFLVSRVTATGVVLIVLGAFLVVWPDIALRRGRAVTIRRAGGGDLTLVIAEDVLKVTSPNWTNSVNWQGGVLRIAERDERWLVYLTKRNAIPIPKSVFNEAEQAQLRTFLLSRTNQPAEPTPA